AGRKRRCAGMAVDRPDQESNGSESGKRAVVGADARCRRIVLDGGVIVAAADALGAVDVRREIEMEPESGCARPSGQWAAVRFRATQQFSERRAWLCLTDVVRSRVAESRCRVSAGRGEEPDQSDASRSGQQAQ